ncbi:hypothetical protein ACMFMG_001655 [Clarireedia jacksonii]
MASHQLAIAKASFSAGLLRPDPRSVSREEIAHFHTLLNTTISECSPVNVQKCKKWILENIVQSAARCTALGKYLTTLTTSLTKSTNREPSIKRKRIHILYILNDLLHHCKYLVNDASISSKIQPTLVALVGSAASFTNCPKHQRKIQDLLDIWQDKGYYSKEYIEKLRETAKIASENGAYLEQTTSVGENGEQGLPSKTSKSVPFVMPAMHGDPSMPWFDLPAGNLMPHIVPNSTRPINPDMIKPLQFVAGPADENLITAVKSLLDDVDAIFDTPSGQDERAALDIDELGQPIILDEVTGEIIDGEGYYGWSRVFCEKMKRRRKGLDQPVNERDRRSQSDSISPQRKRRYSDSGDSRRSSPDRSRRLRRSYSNSSRSASPDRRVQGDGHSRSRSRGRRQDYDDNEPGKSSSGSPQRSVGNGNQPMPEIYPRPAPFSMPQGGFPPTSTYPGQSGMPLPQGLYQPNFHPGFPQPSPIHNQGPIPWPPPPPPPMPNMPFNPANPQWPPPPPPNFPPNFQQPQGFPASGPPPWQPPIQGNQGRGYNKGWSNPSYGGQGRGGRGNYRGRGWS